MRRVVVWNWKCRSVSLDKSCLPPVRFCTTVFKYTTACYYFFCASLIYTALLLYFSFFIIFFRVCSCKIFTCCMAKAVLDYQHDKFPGETFALYFFNCLFLFSRSVELFVVSVIIIIFSIVKQWQVIFTQKRHIISYFEPQLLGVVNFIFKKEKWWFCLYCIFKILIIDSN